MTAALLCTQDDVLGESCPGCGGWLHIAVRGGYAGANGWRYCTEECIADYQSPTGPPAQHHLHMRDLMCACAICVTAGHPTQAERAEWSEYLRDCEGR